MPPRRDTVPLLAEHLAELQGQITTMHRGSAGAARPLWAALQTLAGIVAAILRRLPPE